MPLIQVAWVDGHVSSGERDVIARAAARRRLVFESSRAQLDAWLRQRPEARVFHVSLLALGRMLQRLPTDARSDARRALLDECASTAGASHTAQRARQEGEGEESRLMAHLATALAPEIGRQRD
jgi:hypothetical protein